ncbi:MAG: hypothetical protein ACI4OE_03845 [Alphaproteobacteria bacterium]|nr:hypothetical protein [Alphaproteobacteria bacterium]MDY4689574.1 hypothetical protein [Alphaproteobacteria bacterium]
MEVKYLFAGTLLVCDPELPANCTFFWAGQLTSPDNKVDIIAFRTNSTADFKPMLEKDLAALKSMEQTDNVKAQIAFIQKTLHQMSDSVFVKTPDKALLESAAQGLKLSKLSAGDVVYLSGVAAVMR